MSYLVNEHGEPYDPYIGLIQLKTEGMTIKYNEPFDLDDIRDVVSVLKNKSLRTEGNV